MPTFTNVALSNTFNEFRQAHNDVANTLTDVTTAPATAGNYGASLINAGIVASNTVNATNVTATNIASGNTTVTSLTSGRVVLAGTSGILQDDSGLTFDTTTNALSVTGTTTSGNLVSSGTTSLVGNITVNTNKLTITASNGTISGATANVYVGHVHANTRVHSGSGVAGFLTEIGSNEEKHTFIGVESSNDAIDLAIVNQNAGTLAYSEFIAMNDRGNTDSGWVSMGINSSNYNDPDFQLTKKDDAYILYEAPAGSTGTGDLVIATGSAGTTRKIIFGAGGFATGNTQMEITPDVNVHIEIPTDSSSPTTGALTVVGGVGIQGNMSVGGNVTITGAISLQGSGNTVSTSSLSVTNPIVFLGANNAADILDLGTVGEYKEGATTKYTGIVRDATDKVYKLFSDLTALPGNTVNFSTAGLTFAPLVVGSANVANTTASSSSTTGALTVAGGLGVAGNIYAGTYVYDGYGNLRALPQNAQSGSYSLVAADVGRFVNTTAGVTVPSGTFSVGDNVTIYNNSGSTITITQGGGVTLRQAGTSNTGNRSLALRGVCTVLCVASNEFVINGGGLT
jgi:hypothetical protein